MRQALNKLKSHVPTSLLRATYVRQKGEVRFPFIMAGQSPQDPLPCVCGALEIPSTNIENGGKDQPDRYYVVCLTCHSSNRVDPERRRVPGFATKEEAVADWNTSVQSRG